MLKNRDKTARPSYSEEVLGARRERRNWETICEAVKI